MKVKELLEILAEQDPEREVVLAADGEGNSFSPLSDHSDQYLYVPYSSWDGELWSPEDVDHSDCEHKEGVDVVCDESEPPEDAVPCIVLWPIN